jgi:hypothetical protein
MRCPLSLRLPPVHPRYPPQEFWRASPRPGLGGCTTLRKGCMWVGARMPLLPTVRNGTVNNDGVHAPRRSGVKGRDPDRLAFSSAPADLRQHTAPSAAWPSGMSRICWRSVLVEPSPKRRTASRRSARAACSRRSLCVTEPCGCSRLY